MKKVVLAILDGVGMRDEIKGNAFKQANKKTFDYLWNNYPHSYLKASGIDVGLPKGQMGNSETGHMNIGAGRIAYQPLELINKEIENKNIYQNKQLNIFLDKAKKQNKIHLLGLISDGGVHSHINHLKFLLNYIKQNNIKNIYLHLITDGRDTLPDSAYKYIMEIEKMNIGTISTICGRYYSMDRDKNYDRTEKSYNLYTKGCGEKYNNVKDVFTNNYCKNIFDEYIEPSILNEEGLIKQNDVVLWFNFRPDRAIQILTSLKNITNNILTMMYVSDDLDIPYIFKLDDLNNTLGFYLSKKNIRQLRIAETEKYAHVTYFFDGGKELSLKNCDKKLIKSPKVKTYDLKPEMSAYQITDELLKIINNYDVIILNYANCDMVGHTGNMNATVKAVESVDDNLKKLYDKCIELNYTLVVTADHGNCELMIDENDNIITSHTTNLVPFIICEKNIELKDGRLSDIAPTILDIMKIEKPNEMTGTTLIK